MHPLSRRSSIASASGGCGSDAVISGMHTFDRRMSSAAHDGGPHHHHYNDRRRSAAMSLPTETSGSGFYGHTADGMSFDHDDSAGATSSLAVPRLAFSDDDADGDASADASASLPVPRQHANATRRVVPSDSCYASPLSPLRSAASPRRAPSRAPSRNRGSYGSVNFDTVASPLSGGLELSTDVAIKTMSARALDSSDHGTANQHFDAATSEVAFAERVVQALGTADTTTDLLGPATSVLVQQPSGVVQTADLLPCCVDRPAAREDRKHSHCDARDATAGDGSTAACWRHLAQLHSAELDEAEGRCTVVYEALHGGTLADAVAASRGGTGGGLPAPGLRTVARDVLRGLTALHATFRAVHNDVKLDNAMLTTPAAAACVVGGGGGGCADGECAHAPHVKLIDFGCAALMPVVRTDDDDDENAGTAAGAAADDNEAYAFSQRGALGTMAPERLRGDRYGPKADVWAAGAMLLHAARGRHPFLSPPAAVVARSPAAGAPGTDRFWRLAAVLQFTAGMAEREAATRDAVTAALNDRAPFGADGDEEQFRSFVRFALQADPARRASVAELLAHPWLR